MLLLVDLKIMEMHMLLFSLHRFQSFKNINRWLSYRPASKH
jgi:hypothetical protein